MSLAKLEPIMCLEIRISAHFIILILFEVCCLRAGVAQLLFEKLRTCCVCKMPKMQNGAIFRATVGWCVA